MNAIQFEALDPKKQAEVDAAAAVPIEEAATLWRLKWGDWLVPQQYVILLDPFYYTLGKRLFDAQLLRLNENEEYVLRSDA